MRLSIDLFDWVDLLLRLWLLQQNIRLSYGQRDLLVMSSSLSVGTANATTAADRTFLYLTLAKLDLISSLHTISQ